MILERLPQILSLSRTEKEQLYSELGEMLARDDAWHELSPEVMGELDRQMEVFRRKPETGRSWDDIKARIAAGEHRGIG